MLEAPELGFSGYEPIDLSINPTIKPDPLADYWVVNIPSEGVEGITNVAKTAVDRVLWGQITEGMNFRDHPGLMISYAPLSAVEDEYRTRVFGKAARPEWLSLEEDLKNFSIDGIVPPLDVAILKNSAFLELIKQKVQAAKDLGRKPILFGYSQTAAMEEIAKILGIPYLGNSNFALKAGSKIGLQEFLTRYNLPKLHTVSVYNLEDIKSGLALLANLHYTRAVFKVNFSTGGIGHKAIDIQEALAYITAHQDAPESEVFNYLVPIEYFPGEGLVLQGWIDRQHQEALASIDIMMMPNGEVEITHMKTKLNIGANNPHPSAGYVPIDKQLFEKTLPIAQALKAAYAEEKAVGPHCVNVIFISKEACELYGFEYGVPIIHDENSRIGAGIISYRWVNAVREAKPGTGWIDKIVKTAPNMSATDILSRLREHGLLIEKASSDAHGIFVYDIGKVEMGIHQCNLVAISQNDDIWEAAELLTQAENLLTA